MPPRYLSPEEVKTALVAGRVVESFLGGTGTLNERRPHIVQYLVIQPERHGFRVLWHWVKAGAQDLYSLPHYMEPIQVVAADPATAVSQAGRFAASAHRFVPHGGAGQEYAAYLQRWGST